jgi:hypothetical protein
MKTPRRKNTKPPAGVSSRAALITGALAAPLIAVLNSQAFAATGPINHGDAGVGGPMLDPPSMIAAGTAIATIGAYRLMKLRGRKPTDE